MRSREDAKKIVAELMERIRKVEKKERLEKVEKSEYNNWYKTMKSEEVPG